MTDLTRYVRSWLTMAGFVLVVASLYAAQPVIVPVTLAALLAFILAGPVTWLEPRIGNGAAVCVVVLVVFAGLGAGAWGLAQQLDGVRQDLPRYRVNLVSKAMDIRRWTRGGAVEEINRTIEGVQQDLGAPPPPPAASAPPASQSLDSGPTSLFSWLGSVSGAAGTAGLVVILVIFMLLERRDLRDRLLTLVGPGHVVLTTRALDEAGHRVARHLTMQTLVNLIYGAIVGTGLWWLGVPYPLVWASLAGVLRFIPYVGPIIGAGAPILVSIAALDGWRGPVLVMTLLLALELFTNMVLETVLYAGAAGVSQVGLLVAVAFWTWLWGPIGLLLAIPLTVCVVVLGKHVPGMSALAVLMSDTPTLAPSEGYYQRVLAHDPGEALELVERRLAADEPRKIYDTVLLPALNQSVLDLAAGLLTRDEQADAVAVMHDLLGETAARVRLAEQESPGGSVGTTGTGSELRVLGIPVHGAVDELALHVLARMVDDLPIRIEIGAKLLTSEIADWIEHSGADIVCFADLPPHVSSRTQYLIRRLRKTMPDVRIAVGRWASREFADTDSDDLVRAGANHVGATMAATRSYLRECGAQPARGREEQLIMGVV